MTRGVDELVLARLTEGMAEFDVDGFRVELLDAPQSLEAKNADELFGMANNPGITGRSRRRRRE